MIEHVTGVVLAGGKSTRMGKNKAFLLFEGKTLIERSIEKLSAIFSRVIISVNNTGMFSHLHLPKISDRYVETGPLGAITSVLESGEKRIFCIACDMPFVNQNLVEYLCSFQDDDAVIPKWNDRLEVLHAVYSEALLPAFQNALSRKHFRLIDALSGPRIRFLQQKEIELIDPCGISFRNVNTPQDYLELPARTAGSKTDP